MMWLGTCVNRAERRFRGGFVSLTRLPVSHRIREVLFLSERIIPHLCGGVFFTLLVEASNERIAPRKGIAGIHGDTNDSLIMKGLVDLFAEGYIPFDQQDFSGSVSKYKNCSINYGRSLPFHKEDYLLYANDKLTLDADRALFLMTSLLRKYFITRRLDGTSPIEKAGTDPKYGTFINKGVFIDNINGNFTFRK